MIEFKKALKASQIDDQTLERRVYETLQQKQSFNKTKWIPFFALPLGAFLTFYYLFARNSELMNFAGSVSCFFGYIALLYYQSEKQLDLFEEYLERKGVTPKNPVQPKS